MDTEPTGTLDEYFEPACYERLEDYKMSNAELLNRIDERTRNIWATVEKLEVHQKEANGHSRRNMEQTAKNTTWIIALRWGFGFLAIAVIGAVTTGIIGVW